MQPKLKKLHKRPILLLEVLIAFAIIALCILPLLYPHAALLKSQKEFIRKIDLDHQVNLIASHMMERFYMNEIEWNVIESELIYPLKIDQIHEIGPKFPFKAGYQFKIAHSKPPKKENPPVTANVIEVTLLFAPKDADETFEQLIQNKDKKLERYIFSVFIKRDTTQGLQESEKTEQTGASAKEEIDVQN